MSKQAEQYSLAQLHDDNLAYFIDNLGTSEQWYVFRNNCQGQREKLGVFDTREGLLYSSDTQVTEFLEKHVVVEIRDQTKGVVVGWFDYSAGLLWRPAACIKPTVEAGGSPI